MDLKKYFTTTQGTGVLATAAASGEVTTALYAKPHCTEGDSLAFVMRQRLTHANLQSNGHASYLFLEQGSGHQGIRLSLEKTDESDDPQLIASLTRRHLSPAEDRAKGPKYLVRFRVTKVLPLVGDGQVLE